MLTWALVAAIIVLLAVIWWLLRPRSRGGQRGELEFDWPLINTEGHAHPGTWCSPDYCGSERRPLHRRPRQPLSKAS